MPALCVGGTYRLYGSGQVPQNEISETCVSFIHVGVFGLMRIFEYGSRTNKNVDEKIQILRKCTRSMLIIRVHYALASKMRRTRQLV